MTIQRYQKWFYQHYRHYRSDQHYRSDNLVYKPKRMAKFSILINIVRTNYLLHLSRLHLRLINVEVLSFLFPMNGDNPKKQER